MLRATLCRLGPAALGVAIGIAGACGTAVVAAVPAGGIWTRSATEHGEAWTYRFPVPEAPSRRGPAQPNARVLIAAGLDFEAQRAYLRTQSGGDGTEVATLPVGQTVYFHLDYQVTGMGTATATHRALLDGSTFCSFTESASPGSFFAWCNDGWVATAGAHTLRWELDTTNTAAETDETNNAVATNWTTASGAADFAALRAYLRSAPGGAGTEVPAPALGQTVYLHLDYLVTGEASPPVSHRALLDDSTFCSFNEPEEPGSFFAWCNDAWVATAGMHTLRWELDYTNAVIEPNETDNAASTAWTTGGSVCVGDCNGDGDVTVDELLTMVNIALGNTPVSACTAGDASGDGEITVDEILTAVNNSISLSR